MRYSWLFLLIFFFNSAYSQNRDEFSNTVFLKNLNRSQAYLELKNKIINKYANIPPGKWGEFVRGTYGNLLTKEKTIALSFDACGAEKGSGYDKELIDFLHKEKIAATLFITGKWIDRHYETFLSLSRDTLFEIENHGLNHKPCSMDGKRAYGIRGTLNVAEAFEEMEANARKIEAIIKTKPRFYRSATAYIDESSVRMAGELGIKVVSYKVLSGDAVAFTPDSIIESNVLKNISPGAIVIMHFNHPEWNTYEAMLKIVPELRKMGYKFVKLNEFELMTK
jgi:peptidoglycan/xylan/chitin deacetylase (PgdA/CDA1 family)